MKSLTNVEMNELSEDELMMVDGGDWGWKDTAVVCAAVAVVGTATVLSGGSITAQVTTAAGATAKATLEGDN